jgi:hypothetical protein
MKSQAEIIIGDRDNVGESASLIRLLIGDWYKRRAYFN